MIDMITFERMMAERLRLNLNAAKCDKAMKHNYHQVYGKLFSNIMDRDHLNILEIGVFKGASTEAWLNFFDGLKDVVVVGVDLFERVDLERVQERLGDRAILIQGDSTDPKTLEQIPEGMRFDVIIDDGAHDPGTQLGTYQNFRPLLKPQRGSFYCVEDVWPFDQMTPDEKRHPWILRHRDDYTEEKFLDLLTAMDRPTRFDNRVHTGEPDSYCLVETV